MTDILDSFLNSSDTDAELYPIFIPLSLCASATTDEAVRALDANPYA